MRDERSYPNATEFIPERFFGKPAEGRNAMEANFGFGRRYVQNARYPTYSHIDIRR